LHAAENPLIRTPHLDALARDGTRFSANITLNLVCRPRAPRY
jgi:arylsulfatase A-like enzyme